MKFRLTINALALIFLISLFSCEKVKRGDYYDLVTEVIPFDAGTISASPNKGSYDKGAVVGLSAIPSAHYEFKEWSGDVHGIIKASNTSVTMNNNMHVIAIFESIPYRLTFNIVGEGNITQIEGITATVDGSEWIFPYNKDGYILAFQARAEENWVFEGWSGDVSETDDMLDLALYDDLAITATFVEQQQYPLSIEIEGGGTVAQEVIPQKKSTDYPAGTVVSLTANPDEGWEFAEWSGDYAGYENPLTVTVDKAMTIKAIFVQ